MMSWGLYRNKLIVDAGKFVLHNLAIEGVGAVAVKATEAVGAISL